MFIWSSLLKESSMRVRSLERRVGQILPWHIHTHSLLACRVPQHHPSGLGSIGPALCVGCPAGWALPEHHPACLSQQPQQDSITPCASCVIPSSCTQGRECSAVFVCRDRPVSSPVPMSQPSRTGKNLKNIQLCVHGKTKETFRGCNRSG